MVLFFQVRTTFSSICSTFTVRQFCFQYSNLVLVYPVYTQSYFKWVERDQIFNMIDVLNHHPVVARPNTIVFSVYYLHSILTTFFFVLIPSCKTYCERAQCDWAIMFDRFDRFDRLYCLKNSYRRYVCILYVLGITTILHLAYSRASQDR